MTGEIERGIVKPAAQEAREPRTQWLVYLGVGLFLGGLAWLAVITFNQSGEIAAQSGEIAALQDDTRASRLQAVQLAEQVRQLGGTPVVQPAPVVLPGATGAQGIPGRDGPPGKSPACLNTPQQCQGADGAPGQPGAQGAPGVAGPAGKDGAPGADGAPGKDGSPGQDGAPGVSVTRQYFDRDDAGECHNYNDFSDGRTRVDQGPAGDAACPAAPPTPPPTQTTPAVLPTGIRTRPRD